MSVAVGVGLSVHGKDLEFPSAALVSVVGSALDEAGLSVHGKDLEFPSAALVSVMGLALNEVSW